MKKRLPEKGKTKSKKGKGKAPAKRAVKMTDGELSAAVEAYENSAEGKAERKPKPASRAAQLTKLFYQTPEGQELRQMADSINGKLDPEDTVSIKIDVPKEFIRLTEFLEQKRAAGASATARPAAKVLNQILLNELHDQLHWLVVGPARYEFFRNLWNRFCDVQGAPEEKIDDGQSAAKKGQTEGTLLKLAALLAAVLLWAVAPAFAQSDGRQALADAIEAANAQLDIDVGRAQVRAHQMSSEAFRQGEADRLEHISRLRNRWSGTLHRWTFESAYNRALTDPVYRYQALAEYDQSPSLFKQIAWPQSFWDVVQWIIGAGIIGFVVLCIWSVAHLMGREKPAVPPQPQTSDTFGSASFADPRPYPPDQMYIFNGVFFGKSSQPSPAHLKPFAEHQGGPICSTPENHTLIVAKTRTGKGTRVIIPTLLRYATGSALVIDPKGENAAVTARARQALLQQIHIINPWGVKAGVFDKLGFAPATYNPLDLLDRHDPNAVAIAESLALAICPLKGSRDDYWTESSASLLTAVLLWLTDQPGETKTLARARDIVTRSRKDLKENFLVKMAASSAFSGAIRENAASFIDLADTTYSGVISNLNTQTKFLSDPQIKANTATSSFSMQDLTNKRVTVYVIIPPGRVRAQRTWLRLIISAGMQTFKQQETAVRQRCMFLVDELPALGRLEDLPDDISSMSGYGVDFTLIVQGLDQLKARYGDDAATIINNCHYKWFCNIGDLESAKYLSQSLGKKTVQTTNKSTSLGHNPGGGSSGESTSHGETGRDLLMPDEILNLGRDTAILLNPTERPNYLRPIDYWDLPEAFAHLQEVDGFSHFYWGKAPLRYDPNPYRVQQKTPA